MATDTVEESTKTPKAKKSTRKAKSTGRPKNVSSQKRKFSTPAERAKIVATANREGLTAQQVQQRFGVKPVTYYSWRKTIKGKPTPVRAVSNGALAGIDLTGHVREALRSEIRRMVPGMIEAEVAAVIHGSARRGRRRK
jgi:transposase-like protein